MEFSHRVLGGSSQLFQPLENLLMEKTLPEILGVSSISSKERRLFCLPARKCGLEVSNPTSFADESYNTSREAVTVLYGANVDQHGFFFFMKTTESKCLDSGKIIIK